MLIAADSAGPPRSAARDAARARPRRRDASPGWHDVRRRRRAARADRRAGHRRAHAHRRRRSRCLAKRSCSAQRARQERRRKRAALDPRGDPARSAGPRRRARPSCTRNTASAATSACSPWKSPARTANSSCSNTLDGDRVYVPVQSLHLVSRYTGAAPESAPLHKLGTDQWAKARKRAAEQIRDVAAELLDLYARARRSKGSSCRVRELEYQAFANAFPFEETDDQARGHPPGARGPRERAADGPHRLRRRRLRQDRGRDARGVRRRAGRQAGGRARADHPARPAAPHQLPRPLRRLAGAHRIAVALRQRQGDRRPSLEGIERGTVDIVIATHRLLHAQRALQGSRASSSSTRSTASACATRSG